MGSTRNSDDLTPAAKLFAKPYREWTKKQREWFEREFKRSRLGASPRGRKALSIYGDLYRERELAKLSGSKGPSHRDQASKIPDKADPNYVDKRTGVTEGEYRRQRFIRASQRRQRIFLILLKTDNFPFLEFRVPLLVHVRR